MIDDEVVLFFQGFYFSKGLDLGGDIGFGGCLCWWGFEIKGFELLVDWEFSFRGRSDLGWFAFS